MNALAAFGLAFRSSSGSVSGGSGGSGNNEPHSPTPVTDKSITGTSPRHTRKASSSSQSVELPSSGQNSPSGKHGTSSDEDMTIASSTCSGGQDNQHVDQQSFDDSVDASPALAAERILLNVDSRATMLEDLEEQIPPEGTTMTTTTMTTTTTEDDAVSVVSSTNEQVSSSSQPVIQSDSSSPRIITTTTTTTTPMECLSRTRVRLLVDNDEIGCILGRHGATISKIRSLVGELVKISIGTVLNGVGREITVEGPGSDTLNATKLLLTQLASFHELKSGGGNGGDHESQSPSSPTLVSNLIPQDKVVNVTFSIRLLISNRVRRQLTLHNCDLLHSYLADYQCKTTLCSARLTNSVRPHWVAVLNGVVPSILRTLSVILPLEHPLTEKVVLDRSALPASYTVEWIPTQETQHESPFCVREEIFTVPCELVGRIIGPKGSNVSRIRSLTHCLIFISREPITSRTVRLFGTREQRASAKVMIVSSLVQ